MTWTTLQMISLGSLLFVGDRSMCTGTSRCISEEELNQRAKKFNRLDGKQLLAGGYTTTCEQVAYLGTNDLNSRSISPWSYRVDQNENRLPRDIIMAKCLCQGCIVNKKENNIYNSVEVTKQIKVFYTSTCTDDPSKYELKTEFINVPVACTCAVPKY